ARRQILRNRPPLASRAQDVHDPIHHLAHIDVAPVAPTLGRPDKGADKRPFVVGQVAGISQVATVVSPTVLRRPHRSPSSNQATSLESHMTQSIQFVLGQTLSQLESPRSWVWTRYPGAYSRTLFRSSW